MNLQKQVYRKYISTLLASVYIFVALFSQNNHQHGSGLFFKDFGFTKTEKTVKNADHTKEFGDCLSCHLLHEGKALPSHNFVFQCFSPNFFEAKIVSKESFFFIAFPFQFYLRGPPQFI